MSRRYSLRAPFVGAAHIAIILSITGARSVEPSKLESEVKAQNGLSVAADSIVVDRVLVLSDDGPTQNVILGQFPRALLNGESQPKPMQLRSGTTYRFRLINTRTDYAATVSIFDDGQLAQWRVVAKDGAGLPASQATQRSATLTLAAGEIYDVEFTTIAPGSLTLQFGAPTQGSIPAQATDVQVVVR